MTTKPNRAPLSKERIVAAAMTFADTNGIDDLSMRKLGSELGAGAMSLYNHVANKDELLVAMIDEVTTKIESPSNISGATDPQAWRATMRASAISARNTYSIHPWAVAIAIRNPPGPARMRYIDSVLAAFANSGLTPELAHHAYHAYEVHISGFMLSQIAFQYDEAQLRQAVAGFLKRTNEDDFPHLVAHAREHLQDRGSDFEFGLDLLLDGFERLR